MKLIIDIDEEDYRECKFRKDLLSLGGEPTDLTFNMRMETLIANGVSLEEEIEKIKQEITMWCNGYLQEEIGKDINKIIDKNIAKLKEEVENQKIGYWIPVNERLPEFGQDVLLSLRSLDIKTGFRAKSEPYFYCHDVDGCYIEPQNVLAWMSLPQPYNAESEE